METWRGTLFDMQSLLAQGAVWSQNHWLDCYDTTGMQLDLQSLPGSGVMWSQNHCLDNIKAFESWLDQWHSLLSITDGRRDLVFTCDLAFLDNMYSPGLNLKVVKCTEHLPSIQSFDGMAYSDAML